MPTSVQKPATPPTDSATAWYCSCVIPTASVHDIGMTRPPMCPTMTNTSPKWNSGLPIRSSRDS